MSGFTVPKAEVPLTSFNPDRKTAILNGAAGFVDFLIFLIDAFRADADTVRADTGLAR